MSNSFTSPPTIPDTGDLIAGRTITTTTLQRMGDLSNYIHAHGGTSNVISQAFDQNTCVTASTSYVDLCRYRIPIPSNQHTTIDFHIIAKVTTTGTGTVKFTLTDGNSVAQGNSTISVTATSYTAYTVSHTFTAATTAEYVDVIMAGKVATASTYDLDLQMVAARFTALTSPLAAGSTKQATAILTPFGINRLGADYALSSRAGKQWRRNIETMRSRKRMLLGWSGIENPSSVFSGRGQGPKALGMGDVATMQNQSMLFVGGGTITVSIYVVNVSGTQYFSFMNQLLEVTSNGWNQYSLTPNLDDISLESRSFGISLYKIQPTLYYSSDTLLDTTSRQAVINGLGRVTALSVWSN